MCYISFGWVHLTILNVMVVPTKLYRSRLPLAYFCERQWSRKLRRKFDGAANAGAKIKTYYHYYVCQQLFWWCFDYYQKEASGCNAFSNTNDDEDVMHLPTKRKWNFCCTLFQLLFITINRKFVISEQRKKRKNASEPIPNFFLSFLGCSHHVQIVIWFGSWRTSTNEW